MISDLYAVKNLLRGGLQRHSARAICMILAGIFGSCLTILRGGPGDGSQGTEWYCTFPESHLILGKKSYQSRGGSSECG